MQYESDWLEAEENKIKENKFEGDLKIKLFGKRLHPTESVKYLGVKIVTNLSWQYHVNDLSIKANRTNALLFKMRKYDSLKIRRSIYLTIFTPTYPTAVLPGLRIVALFNE